MTDAIAIARDQILSPAGLDTGHIEQLLGQLKTTAIDAADIYFQYSRLQSWMLEDGIIKDGNFNIERGAGLRAQSGEKTGFAYADEVQFETLMQAAKAARAIARSGGEGRVKLEGIGTGRRLYEPIDPLGSLSDEDKVALLHRVDEEARRLDPRVRQVIASLVAVRDLVLIASDDGRLSADVRPLVRLNVSVIVEDGDRREQGASGVAPGPTWATSWPRTGPWAMPGRPSIRP
jgi:TldD protein